MAGIDRRLATQRNNFHFLRLLFALAAFFHHAYALSGQTGWKGFYLAVVTKIAIQGFFVISGFLIVKSYMQSNGPLAYFQKRARRIFPAYFMVILLCAIFGAAISALPAAEYFFSIRFWRYLACNLLFVNWLQPTLPGVFEGNPAPFMNVSLWTIKVELSFYLVTPLLVWATRRFNRVCLFLGIYGCSAAWHWGMNFLAEATGQGVWGLLSHQLPGQMSYFLCGAYLYLYKDAFLRQAHGIAAGCLAALVCHLATGVEAMRPLAISGLVIYLAYVAPYLGNCIRFGDLSYGAYIYHGPIIQFLVMAGLYHYNPYWGTLASMMILLAVSCLSWHFLEKRFLLGCSHYRRMCAKAAPATVGQESLGDLEKALPA